MLAALVSSSRGKLCGPQPLLLQVNRSFAVVGRKSKNVASKKNKLDGQRMKLFHRLAVNIFMAAKSGGPDPNVNKDLERCIRDAHVNRVPKDNIDRMIKKASDNTTEGYKKGIYEVYGHGGVGIVVQTLSDNSNRALQALKIAIKKGEAKMAAAGSVLFQFDEKGVIKLNIPYDEDEIIELALEKGVDSVDFINPIDSEEENSPKWIVTDVDSLATLQDAISQKFADKQPIITADCEYIAKDLMEISDEMYDLNTILIDALEDVEEVDKVFHNIA